jgi:hypothetical protein
MSDAGGPDRARLPVAAHRHPAVRRGALVLGAIAPGALAGVFLAGLLFFLNPLWPFSPGPVAHAVARYATILGLASLALILPWTWRQPSLASRVVPWSLVGVFWAAGCAAWVHASLFSLYLPPGINQRLIKAALWLSLAGVATFYTVLVHAVRRRRLGPRSHLWLAALTVLTVYAVFERREAFDPPVPLPPRPSSVERAERPSLLVVGLSGATLDVVLPLAEQGQLPFFAELMRAGTYGRLRSLEPTRSRPLWTTVATGKLPFRHGVVSDRFFPAGFVAEGEVFRLLPLGLGFETWGLPGGAVPHSSTRPLLSLPIWSILDRLGLQTSLAGWPGAAPPSNGIAVSSDAGAAPSSSADPLELALRPDLDVLMDAGRWLAGEGASSTSPRFAFVHLASLEEVSRQTFGGFSAVQFDGRQDADSAAAARELGRAYATIDDRLARTWKGLPEPKLLAVVSPYGVRTLSSFERLRSLSPGASSLEGRISGGPDGVLLLLGPGVQVGRFLSRAAASDVVPTLLYAIGFPAALDFDGRVLTDAFTSEHLARHPLSFIPSYETTRSLPR